MSNKLWSLSLYCWCYLCWWPPARRQPPLPPRKRRPNSRPATQARCPATGLQIPEIQDGKFNVAAVLIGPHDDGGWSQAHYEGLEYVQKNVPNTHIAYIENVPEGTESEQVIRSLARKGFDLILTTSFGYMDPTATVAEEFPDQTFIHISGFKSNKKNFGDLFGAMEDMKYLAGMIAGARAKQDGNPKLGHGDLPHAGRIACHCIGRRSGDEMDALINTWMIR
jgi:basic membrane protein A